MSRLFSLFSLSSLTKEVSLTERATIDCSYIKNTHHPVAKRDPDFDKVLDLHDKLSMP